MGCTGRTARLTFRLDLASSLIFLSGSSRGGGRTLVISSSSQLSSSLGVITSECRSDPSMLALAYLLCPLSLECTVGAVLRLASVPCSYDTDERDAEERDENETVDMGGDCGGNGIAAGSTLAVTV